MIDFDEMNRRHQEGLTQVDSLEGDEKTVLMHYCSLATEVLMRLAAHRKAPVNELAVNAYKNGIALGLRLRITQGEVQGR